MINAYKALYYGYFGCAPALRWKRYLPGRYEVQLIFAKINGKRLVYHSISKNASTTVKSLLLDATGHPVPALVGDVHTAFHPHRYKHWRKCTSSDLSLAYSLITNFDPSPGIPPGFDRAFHFAFVRNPWARLVSCYVNKVFHRSEEFAQHYPSIRLERMTFTDFVRFVCRVPDDLCDRHFALQCRILDIGGSTLDFVGRVERFSDDLAEIIRLSGLDKRLLKWTQIKNQSRLVPSRRYMDLYTTQTRNLAACKYAKDIDRFGYRFGD